jgi:hypothetical protein
MIKSVIITDLSTAVSTSFKDCIQTVWISAVDEADQKKNSNDEKKFFSKTNSTFCTIFL